MTIYTILNSIERKLKESLPGKDVKLVQKSTNNGTYCFGVDICISKNRHQVIYIDDYVYMIYTGATSIDKAVGEIVDAYNRSSLDTNKSKLFTKDHILQNVVYKLVNLELNKELLKNVPHRIINDLAVIYRVVIDFNENDGLTSTYTVTNEMIKSNVCTLNELEAAANINTKNQGFFKKKLHEVIAEMTEVPLSMIEPSPLYVLSNKNRFCGASILLYPDELYELANELKDDLYILPSSIHEVLALPVGCNDADDLIEMVGEVNSTEVVGDDILGYSVYKFDRKTKSLTIA